MDQKQQLEFLEKSCKIFTAGVSESVWFDVVQEICLKVIPLATEIVTWMNCSNYGFLQFKINPSVIKDLKTLLGEIGKYHGVNSRNGTPLVEQSVKAAVRLKFPILLHKLVIYVTAKFVEMVNNFSCFYSRILTMNRLVTIHNSSSEIDVKACETLGHYYSPWINKVLWNDSGFGAFSVWPK
jgi:hypothetical protein